MNKIDQKVNNRSENDEAPDSPYDPIEDPRQSTFNLQPPPVPEKGEVSERLPFFHK